MGQQYLSPQQGRVPILSLWDRQPGGGVKLRFEPQSSFWTSPRPPPPALLPSISREQEFSQDTDPPGTLPGGVTLQHQWGAIGILSLGLAWGSAAGRPLSMHTNAFTPRDLENKSFPGIPIPRGVNGATIPITTTGSRPSLKPLW